VQRDEHDRAGIRALGTRSGKSVLSRSGLLVITLAGDRISGITRFETMVMPALGLPRRLQS